MILMIDNYDSFSYNLYQLIGSINRDIRVIRNDKITVEEIEKLAPGGIILSPGPGSPSDAGICTEAVKKLSGKIPLLGVCLGHQAIYEAFGGTVSYAKKLMHGKTSEMMLDTNNSLFRGLPPSIRAARYHSLSAVRDTLPKELDITAETCDGEIMAISHKRFRVYGVQFHPESILTPEGTVILQNFLDGCKNESGGLIKSDF